MSASTRALRELSAAEMARVEGGALLPAGAAAGTVPGLILLFLIQLLAAFAGGSFPGVNPAGIAGFDLGPDDGDDGDDGGDD